MSFIDYRDNPKLYAEIYSKLDITGTQFIAFRDLPKLISKYVNGINTIDGSVANRKVV